MAQLSGILMLTTSLMLVACLSLAIGSAENVNSRLIRVNLFKKIMAKDGDLGQPQTSYYVKANVGTPAKEFKMLIDVNGREIWLPHYSKMGLILRRLNYMDGYCKKDSSTSAKEPDTYTTCYRDTKLSGKAYVDEFELQNVTESLSEVKFRQRLLAISDASNDKFSKFGVDGVLALNPWPISETGSDLIALSMSKANLTSRLMFALELDNNDETERGGELTFGGFNPTKFLGGLRFHKGLGQHVWELRLQSVMLGAQTIATSNDESVALVSTSSNDIYAPARFVERILRLLGLIDGQGQFDEEQLYTIDCLKVVSSPSLTFVIDDTYYVLHPLSYIKKKTDGIVFKTQSCYVAILSSGSGNKWELGTNFLANYYTVFDINENAIAFALKYQN